MAQGLGFIEFATGDVLSAAAANGYLASQTVMVFADATARTAAIATPYEGMMSYLKDTNSVEYYSGSAWVAVSGGASGGMTLLSTTTLSGTSTTVSSISQLYKKLYIIISGITSNSNQVVFRIAPNGTTNAVDYAMSRSVGGSASVVASSNGYIDTYSAVQYDSAVNAFTLELNNYASSTYRKSYNFYGGFRQSDPSDFAFTQAGIFKSTTAITSLVFSTSANSFTAGQVLVYGVN